MTDLPEGTVTFLFSDLEGSTQLLERHGSSIGDVLARHHDLVREIVDGHGGAVFETVGDAVYAAFARPAQAVAAATRIQLALRSEDWGTIRDVRARMALHTGEVERRGDHYFGHALFRAARLQAAAHGDQTLLSAVTARLLQDGPPDGASLRDLGRHRLKDLAEAEHVYELVHPDLPRIVAPLRTLDAHRHNLPIQLSTFVGREDELVEVSRLLDENRLVTLIGPGGIGKTRLALQVGAERIDRHVDGVFLVDLHALRDPQLLGGTIAAAVSLGERTASAAGDQLGASLADKELLLILDNVEQLLPGAAATIGELLASAGGVQVLATSRAPIRIRGERQFAVLPLSGGRRGRMDDRPPPAVALFVERARAIRPDLVIDGSSGPLIAEICTRLDGLPLAIELAASRLRLLSLPALGERLARRLPLLAGGDRDLPERQQTLRGTIAWSEEMLPPEERRLLRWLGVMSGGFTAEAAGAVVADRGIDILGALEALIDHSLVHQIGGLTDAPRYGMLDTIAEYALERLVDAGEVTEARDRHLALFLQLAERAYDERLASASKWFPLVEAEHHNLRAAVDWTADKAESRTRALLLGAVSYYWLLQGHVGEVLQLGTSALEKYREPDGIRGRLLVQMAEAERRRGVRGDHALALLQEALEIYRRTDDPAGEAAALETRGLLLVSAGDHEGAREALEHSLALRRSIDAPELEIALSLEGLCSLHVSIGDVEQAEEAAHQLRRLGERHDSRLEQVALHFLADCPLIAGDFAEAEKRYLRALARARQLAMTTQAASELIGVAMAIAGQGDHERALRLSAVAHARRRAAGLTATYLHWWDQLQERHIGGAREKLGPERAAAAEREGREMDWDGVLDDMLSAPRASG